MKKTLSLLFSMIVFVGCSSPEENITDPITIDPIVPTVTSNAMYGVTLFEDITYAQGLSHESINSVTSTNMELKLDVYVPNNDSNNRPVFMYIHGGGFMTGNKQAGVIPILADYYASRGFVFVSINYRLLDDFGTIPTLWETNATFVDPDWAPQYLALYPSQRDAKAALRWIVVNAETYGINTNYITVGGGSAGAVTAITLGVSEPQDFRDEISLDTDPTLLTTNLESSYDIKTIVDFWGSKVALDAHEEIYGSNRFGSNDPPLFIAHGTEDLTVLYSSATDLQAIYETYNIPYVLYTLEGAGHAPWGVQVDGKPLSQLSFEFVVEQQELSVE